jgi:hypothetical protein
MTSDRYTKFLLTVIAVCLSVLAADKVYSTMVPVAHAGSQQLVSCATGGRSYKNNYCMPVIIGK